MYHDSSRALAEADLEIGCCLSSSRKKGRAPRRALFGSDRYALLSHHAGNAKRYPARRDDGDAVGGDAVCQGKKFRRRGAAGGVCALLQRPCV